MRIDVTRIASELVDDEQHYDVHNCIDFDDRACKSTCTRCRF
jgi:hypothetical protein